MLCNFIGLLPHTVNLFKTVYPHKCIEKKLQVKLPPLHYVIFYVSYFVKIFRICSYCANLFKTTILAPVSARVYSLSPKGPGNEVVKIGTQRPKAEAKVR